MARTTLEPVGGYLAWHGQPRQHGWSSNWHSTGGWVTAPAPVRERVTTESIGVSVADFYARFSLGGRVSDFVMTRAEHRAEQKVESRVKSNRWVIGI